MNTFCRRIWHCTVSVLLMCFALLKLSLLSLTVIHVGISIWQGSGMCTVRRRQHSEERSMSLHSQKCLYKTGHHHGRLQALSSKGCQTFPVSCGSEPNDP